MYNEITKKLANRVLNIEQQRRNQVASEFEAKSQALPKAYLLIADNDSNLGEELEMSKPEILSNP